jgi:hypothetical protein
MQKLAKDPGAVLDYTFDWADYLAEGETIQSVEVVTDIPELEIDQVTSDATTVTAWLSGGANEAAGLVTCAIVTDQARADERSIYVVVLDQ